MPNILESTSDIDERYERVRLTNALLTQGMQNVRAPSYGRADFDVESVMVAPQVRSCNASIVQSRNGFMVGIISFGN